MERLNFLVPIFKIKVKVRVGDINRLMAKYSPNLIPPIRSFHQSCDGFELIALPHDWEKYCDYECGRLAREIARSIGAPTNDCTKEFVRHIQDYLTHYIKNNL